MTSKALCVGINKFANLPQASWLNGCVNDALDMAAFLETRPEFSGGHIKILKDTAATKAKVMGALRDLIADEDADHIVFSFSSHGTQVPDKNGDEKVDHVDEAFACHDLKQKGRDWDRNTVITDDELTELTSRFDREAYPVLTPLGVGPGQPFPYISGLSMSLGVFVREPERRRADLRPRQPPVHSPQRVESCRHARNGARGGPDGVVDELLAEGDLQLDERRTGSARNRTEAVQVSDCSGRRVEVDRVTASQQAGHDRLRHTGGKAGGDRGVRGRSACLQDLDPGGGRRRMARGDGCRQHPC